MIFFDTETCGFHGPTVLIQWAEGHDGDIHLHSVWTEPIIDTLTLIERLCATEVVAFNLAFDWFHICQTYTTLLLLGEKVGFDAYPEDHIDEYAVLEKDARLGPCLKPKGALDLMLHARKGPYQSTMDRSDVRIRRVPTQLAQSLATELSQRIPLKDVYFARFKDTKRRWQVYDIHDDLDEVIPEFKDVVLKFAPSSALKALANDALGIDTDKIKLFSEVGLPKSAYPVEYGYAPFAIGEPGKWKGAWPDVIQHHISHWGYNKFAREYATDDVKYLQLLYNYFERPDLNDDDSILAALVGSVRWRGFSIDPDGLRALKKEKQKEVAKLGFSHSSPKIIRRYLEEVLDPTEALVMQDGQGKISTKGIILEELAKWRIETVCDDCMGFGCNKCDAGLVKSDKLHPAAIRAGKVLDARRAAKRIQLIDKLLLAGRFHASVKVIGTLSSRMAGADGMNPQGIPHDKVFRRLFTLADRGLVLCGGDFSGFEICLMDAAYGDPVLRAKLLTKRPCHVCKGTIVLDCPECQGTGETDTKIHALFGVYLFASENLTYDDILATKGLPGEQDKYDRSKKGVYATAYGGESYTLQTRVGISEEDADAAFAKWCDEHKVWGAERKRISDLFCSMQQPGGIGSKVEWHEPADYIESMFGFKRYFTLENTICRVLFDLAESPPKEWEAMKIKVVRRDRIQSACGAVRSALFGAAFQIQAANMRAAGNHVIQSSGAQVTKMLQVKCWALQPAGIHPWVIQPLNIHDEIMAPTDPDYVDRLDQIQRDFLVWLKTRVPLAEIDWGGPLRSWAEK